MGAKTNEMSIGISREDGGNDRKKTSMFPIKFLSAIAELENDPYKDFIKNIENGATIGYEADLGNFHEVPHGETKLRVYDEQRCF